ncbi:MAG: hypothetical protein OXC41_08155 [Gammaproteobacteria bacterium]|nr:hypothetical protein [Gammaproteobacteria bacterium]
MANSQLDNLVRASQLTAAEEEIGGLFRSGTHRIDDAGRKDLSLESCFDLGYNAAHSLVLATLRFHGYRSPIRVIWSFDTCNTLSVYLGQCTTLKP